MTTQPERIASLESHRGYQWTAITAVAVIGLGWLSWVSTTLITLKGDMQAIKQKMKDGGLGDIVSELQTPKSPDQLKANLSTVVAQVQTAKANGVRPDTNKVNSLSFALSKVVEHNPELSEAWKAATETVSYRSGESNESSGNCFNQMGVGFSSATMSDDNHKVEVPPSLNYKNCRFLLSDVEGYEKAMGSDFQKHAKNYDFYLRQVQVVYHGGPVIPFAHLICSSCTFDLDVSAPPPSQIQVLTKQLLLAQNYSNIHLAGVDSETIQWQEVYPKR